MTEAVQLELFPNAQVASAPTPRDSRFTKTPEQQAAFEAFLAKCREETWEMNEIGRELFGQDFLSLKECPIEQLRAIRERYDTIHPRPQPSLSQEEEEDEEEAIAPKPQKPIKRWSDVAKHRHRIRLMVERIRKKYTLPVLYIEAVQDKLLTNPQYYGVCPLPGSCDSARIHIDFKTLIAIERENELRSQGL